MEANSKIRVLLVDDHPIVLEGLKHVMQRAARLQIVGAARDGKEAISKARSLRPDVIVMDIAMPGTDGIEATRTLAKDFPDIRVLGLSMHDSPYYQREMADAGAAGYIVKTTPPAEMIRIIERVHAGERWFAPVDAETEEAPSSGRHRRPLSRRELEVLRLIADGNSNKLIAERLGISVRTVETHRERIMRKLEVQGTAGLTKWAVVHGLVDPTG